MLIASLTNYGRLQIDKDGTRDMFSSASLAEEGVERIVSVTDRLVGWHQAVWLNTVLEAVQLPAGISDLDTGLSNVYRDTLTLK